MTRYFEADLERYSAILSDNLNDVVTELRTIDLVDIVSYIRYGSFATLDDLIQSSTELFFKPERSASLGQRGWSSGGTNRRS